MRSQVPFALTSLFFFPACALGAWAAGCTDDAAPMTPGDDDDASAPIDSSVPPQTDAGDGGNGDAGECALDGDGIWRTLKCSGLYASFTEKTLASDVRPYRPAVELWSDGAEKQRWIHLPAGSKIDISDWDEWKFPRGTKLWKEFKLGGKRIETRLFMKLQDDTWTHATYRWNADETDAIRKEGGETIAGLGPDGGPYEIPSSGQCDQCHVGRKDHVLGFDAVNLGLAAATGETLAKLAEGGLLSQAPPATTLTLPGSPEAQAAIGWANANCGACHNSKGAANFRKHFLVRASDLAPADGGAALPLEELDIWKQGYCVNTTRNDPETAQPYKYIRGGTPAKSMMSILAGQRTPPNELPNGGQQMPPIVSRAVDHVGLKLFNDWVTSLPACP